MITEVQHIPSAWTIAQSMNYQKLSLQVNCYYFRFACAIEQEEYVVVTGGGSSSRTVMKYHMGGGSEALPNLITAREAHACGYFTDSHGEIVSCRSKSVYFVY